MNRLALPLAVVATLAASAAHAQTGGTARADGAMVRVTGPSTKVTAPVEVEITPLPDPAPGRRRVRIVVRPSVDAASLRMDVTAESGLSLARPGDATWTVPARVGEEVAREVELSVSGPGELRLVVAATVRHGDDVAQTGIHVFAFNPAASPDAPLTKSLRPARPTDPGGRTIVEVPAARP